MEHTIDPILEGVGGVISCMKVELSLDDVTAKLGGTQSRPALVKAVSKTLGVAQDLWQPQLVYRWVDVVFLDNGTIKLCCDRSKQSSKLSMGFSSKFMSEATKALIGVYTVGQALEDARTQASKEKQILDGYLYDIVGLALLDKLKGYVNKVAEDYCQKRSWGVSPFLSPGSVHGWELEDQVNLCSMLPLERINVGLQENKILLPFKSISFLIGTGPGYQTTEVGTTCEVCSKKDTCVMQTKE